MRYLVIGGTGFVGAYDVRELVNAGHQVTVCDPMPDREFLAEVLGGNTPDAVEVVSGDVTDLPQLLRTMGAAKTERIVHLASTVVAGSESNPLRALKVDCDGTLNMFEAALALGITTVVWAGRSTEYDAPHTRERLRGDKITCGSFSAHQLRGRGLDNVGRAPQGPMATGRVGT